MQATRQACNRAFGERGRLQLAKGGKQFDGFACDIKHGVSLSLEYGDKRLEGGKFNPLRWSDIDHQQQIIRGQPISAGSSADDALGSPPLPRAADCYTVNVQKPLAVSFPCVFCLEFLAGSSTHLRHFLWVGEGPLDLCGQVVRVAWGEEQARAALLYDLGHRA